MKTRILSLFAATLVLGGLAACEDEKTVGEEVSSAAEEVKEGDLKSATEEAGEAVQAAGDSVAEATKNE